MRRRMLGRGAVTRAQSTARRTTAIIAIVVTGAVALAGFGIAPSLAGWTRTDYDNGPVSSLNCSTGNSFSTQSWAQEIAGQVAGTPIDSSLASVLGLTVQSGSPHSTVTSGPPAVDDTYLGSDAWDSALAVGALNSINLGAGLTLPLNQNLSSELQYAKASQAGTATAASGAISTAGGAVSLGSPAPTDPGVGTISLDSALSGTVGQKLAGVTSELANASLTVGALGSETSLDSCTALWDGMTDAASVMRSYVLSKLALTFSSSLVGTTVTDATASVASLTSALNLLQPAGTAVTATSVLNALTSAVSATTSPLLAFNLTNKTVTLGMSFNLAGAISTLTATPITSSDGAVSVNLSTGQLTIDLAKLSGFSSLNSLPANTKLLSSSALSNLVADVNADVSSAITSTLQTAIVALLSSATVTAVIQATLTLVGVNAANVTITIAGHASQFVDPTDNGEPAVSSTRVDLSSGALSLVLGVLNLDTVLNGILSNMVSPLLTDLVPALATAVVSPKLVLANADVAPAISTLNGTTLAPVYTALGGVVTVLGDALEVTVNAQPDVASGSIGSPEPSVTGEYFESALQVGVLNTATTPTSSTLSLFLGSSAVGPDAKK